MQKHSASPPDWPVSDGNLTLPRLFRFLLLLLSLPPPGPAGSIFQRRAEHTRTLINKLRGRVRLLEGVCIIDL